jgi:hypothetical protein
MRRLLLLAPLLLTSCALLYPARAGTTFTHDRYRLTCIELVPEDCIRVADQVVALFMIGSDEYIESMTVAADGKGIICTPSECMDLDTTQLGDPADLPPA